MVIERGRLVPATAYDAERLDTYRQGTSVRVRFVEEKDRIMVRKWFAVLGKAVKDCSTPWKTKDEASEAVKLALGIVNLTKTVGGEFMAYPKSLVDLTDPELDEAVEQMMALIQRITGVDPADWKKEVADYGGEDEHQSSDAAPASPAEMSDEGRDASPSPTQAPSVAATNSEGELDSGNGAGASSESGSAEPDLGAAATPSADAADQGAGESETQHGAVLSPAAELECIRKLLAIVADPALDQKEKAQTIAEAADVWLGALGPERKEFVTTVFTTSKKVLRGEMQAEPARRYLEGLAA